MKMSVRLLCIIMSLIMLLSVVGCGDSDGDSSTEGKVYSTGDLLPKIEITQPKVQVLTHWSIDEVKNQEFNARVKTQYGIDVEFITVDWNDLGTKLTTMVLSNTAPDVYIGRYRDYPLVASKNLVQPLDDIIDMDNPLFKTTKNSIVSVQMNGKTYAATAPDRLGWLLWYNERMIEEAGLDNPRKLYKEGNWNWDTFLQLATDLTDSKNGIFGLGATRVTELLMTTGQYYITQDPKTGVITNNLKNPDVVKALNFWGDLAQRNKVLSTETEPIQAFTQGKIGMLIDGDWLEESQLNEQVKRNDVNFVPLPKYTGTDKYYVEKDFEPIMSIPVGAKNVEGAKAYIMFQLFRRNATEFADQNEEMAQILEEDRQRRITLLGSDDEDFEIQETYKDLVPAYLVSVIPELSEHVNTMADQVRKDGTSWETLVEKNAPQLQAMIDNYNAGLSN